MAFLKLVTTSTGQITVTYIWLNVGGRITVDLISSLTRLDLTTEENMLLFVCSEAVESNLVKLEASCTMILPPIMSVLRLHTGPHLESRGRHT